MRWSYYVTINKKNNQMHGKVTQTTCARTFTFRESGCKSLLCVTMLHMLTCFLLLVNKMIIHRTVLEWCPCWGHIWIALRKALQVPVLEYYVTIWVFVRLQRRTSGRKCTGQRGCKTPSVSFILMAPYRSCGEK